jgi:hypothetical protein
VLQGKAKQLELMWRGSTYGTSAYTLCSRLIVATSFLNCEPTTDIILNRTYNEVETKTDTTSYLKLVEGSDMQKSGLKFEANY